MIEPEDFSGEIGLVSWTLLKAHFKRGALVWVASHLSLEEVASGVINDHREKVEEWMTDKFLTPFPIALAEQEPTLRGCVAQPWVLVQEPGN